jgi:hypothetical protein
MSSRFEFPYIEFYLSTHSTPIPRPLASHATRCSHPENQRHQTLTRSSSQLGSGDTTRIFQRQITTPPTHETMTEIDIDTPGSPTAETQAPPPPAPRPPMTESDIFNMKFSIWTLPMPQPGSSLSSDAERVSSCRIWGSQACEPSHKVGLSGERGGKSSRK